MSDRGARESALETNEDVAAIANDPAMAPVEVVADAEAAGAVGDAIGRLTPPARQEDERSGVERRELAERIGKSLALPPGLRTRLAEVAQAGGSVADVVRAVEESLPGVLRVGGRDATSQEHPAGEVFFRGDADAVSEEQAEALARGQLARSGMLRGQRVRVAE